MAQMVLRHPTRDKGMDTLLTLQLIQCEYVPHDMCSGCARDLGMWFYGFPMPLCVFCLDLRRRGLARHSQSQQVRWPFWDTTRREEGA